MKITDHKTRSVFEPYNIVDTADVSAAMNAVQTHVLKNGQKLLEAEEK
jgi:hypothetical protein